MLLSSLFFLLFPYFLIIPHKLFILISVLFLLCNDLPFALCLYTLELLHLPLMTSLFFSVGRMFTILPSLVSHKDNSSILLNCLLGLLVSSSVLPFSPLFSFSYAFVILPNMPGGITYNSMMYLSCLLISSSLHFPPVFHNLLPQQ